MKSNTFAAWTAVALLLMPCLSSRALAQAGTSVVYQGELARLGVPINDTCEFNFSLWDAESAGIQIGSTISLPAVTVVGGSFSVALDFGATAFGGGNRWLQIEVRCPPDIAFTTLAPRQPFLLVPYSIFAQAANEIFINYRADGSPANMLFSFSGLDEGVPFIEAGLQVYAPGQTLADEPDLILGVDDNGSFLELVGADSGITIYPDQAAFDAGLPGIRIFHFDAAGGNGMQINYPSGSLGLSANPGTISLSNPVGFNVAQMSVHTTLGHGFLTVSTAASTFGVSIDGGSGSISAAGDIGCNGNLSANGDVIAGGAKLFRIPNPLDDSTDIVYACVEGPEAACYVRGTGALVDGRARIDLPDHFRAVVNLDTMTVHLTPTSAKSLGLAVIEKSGDFFVVAELTQGTGTYEFDYYVMGVRKGYEDFQVIRPASNRKEGNEP